MFMQCQLHRRAVLLALFDARVTVKKKARTLNPAPEVPAKHERTLKIQGAVLSQTETVPLADKQAQVQLGAALQDRGAMAY